MYFIYVLRCVDSSLYCGFTTDIIHRLKAHTGKVKGGAKYTKSHPPVKVEAVWRCDSKSLATELERRFKKLRKTDKEALILDPSLFDSFFCGSLDPGSFSAVPDYSGDISEVACGNMEPLARVP